jgi:hypothetical protein
VDDFERTHIACGKALIRTSEDETVASDLCRNVPLWRELWETHKHEIMDNWIETYAGSRPPVWWKFIDAHLPMRLEGEREIDYLERARQIEAREIAFIKSKAVQLLKHNMLRNPADRLSHFIPDSDGLVSYALRHDLIGEVDVPTLEAERWKYSHEFME